MYTIRWFRCVNYSFLVMRHNGRKKHETYEHPKVRTKDINIFIALLIKQYHEVTVFIDANKQFIPGNNGILLDLLIVDTISSMNHIHINEHRNR